MNRFDVTRFVSLTQHGRRGHLLRTDPACMAAQEASENRAACQAALLKAGVLDILIGASLGDGAIASVTVRAQARCLAIYPACPSVFLLLANLLTAIRR